MKLTLSYPLYRRKDPSNNIAPLDFLMDGSVIEITDVVIGKPIDGNSIWYKADDDLYYWSGGFHDAEFVFPEKNFHRLTLPEQFKLSSQAMDYYYDILSKKIQNFSGMSVAFKKTGNQYLNFYALSIQVVEKENHNGFNIPAFLPYRGFEIPTDVVRTSKTESHSLGKSISRIGFETHGSVGFVSTLRSSLHTVLVTNYHVACADLILSRPRILSLLQQLSINDPEIVMPAKGNQGSKTIGKVIEGRLDRFNDVALIGLDDAVTITNSLPVIGRFSGIRTIESITEVFEPGAITLRMFGAVSNFTSADIISVNARQPISYFDGAFVHTLKGLIQVTRMSQPGDSGSAVVDIDNKLAGLLVAADTNFSYILPIENILTNFLLNEPV